jgi:hypothetical protein
VACFKLETQFLRYDEFGESESSCTVKWEQDAPIKANEPKGGNQKLVLNKLRQMIPENGRVHPANALVSQALPLEEAVDIAAQALTCEPRRRSNRARETITALINRRLINLDNDWIWLTERPAGPKQTVRFESPHSHV